MAHQSFREKAEALGVFFEDKLTARDGARRQTSKEVWEGIAELSRPGFMQLAPPISRGEVRLAAKDLPGKRAVGPELFSAGINKKCECLQSFLATLFASMLERRRIPAELRRFFAVSLDKAGKDPTRCENKRPIALLSPHVKLLESILARSILPMVEEQLAEGHYAYQKRRSAEILLAYLDAFVETNARD